MRVKTKVLSTISAVFLMGYLLNVVSIDSFHQALHQHHHSAIHSSEAESDACHRAIYHGEVSASCNHATHLSEQVTACELCEVLTSRGPQFVVAGFLRIAIPDFNPNSLSHFSDVRIEAHLNQIDLRGPPVG